MDKALHRVVSQAEKAADAGDAARAAQILAQYLETHTAETHPYPYYDVAYFLYQSGKTDAAIDYLRKAVRLNPCFVEAWQLLASLYQGTERFRKAADALEQAAAITNDPELWYQTAVLWLNGEQAEKALAGLEKVPSPHRKTSTWHVAAARAHHLLEDPVKAAQAMASAHSLSKDPEQLYQCAVFWMDAGKPGKALPLLRQLTGKDDPKAHWLVALSNTLKALQEKEATAEAMERAAQRSRDPELWFSAGCLWLEADRPKKALVILERLAKRRNPEVKWLLALANTEMILDQTVAAAETMDRVVRMEPKSEYLYNAGVLWLQAQRPERAWGHLQALCRRTPAKAPWFVALAHAWLGRKETVQAAQAMEKAASLSGDPEHAYQAGLLWLQAKRAEAALRMLAPLGENPQPKAPWLVALCNAWVLREDFSHAAAAMERAAHISHKPVHTFRAARLWLEADQPRKALPLLQTLTQRPSPLGKWFIALSNCHVMLDQTKKAARAMENAADITREGKHYYQAGMLWLQAGETQQGIPLLQTAVSRPPVQQQWRVALAQAFMDVEQNQEALAVMERTKLTGPEVSSSVRYQGAVIWLQLERYQKALPVLHLLCRDKRPAQDWLISLVKTHVELGQIKGAEKALHKLTSCYPENPKSWQLSVWLGLEQGDYAKAAAAMAVAVRLAPPDPEQLQRLADLYHMAGVPVKAAATLQKTWKKRPTAEDWDRLTHIYLSGHRYDMALTAARSAVSTQESAERWKSIGAITFRLRRFAESYDAYGRAMALRPDAGISLRAGYAAMKLNKWKEATRLFKAAMRQARKNSKIAYEAHRNLAFIKKMRAAQEKGG
ncbi:MAG: tetratricopeptide repeat protein, partial [Desulfobacteraceae bacterium]